MSILSENRRLGLKVMIRGQKLCVSLILKVKGACFSGVTGGGTGAGVQIATQRLLTGKFLLTFREKKGKERGKEKREKLNDVQF